ncbi:MAG: AsmA family protein [Alphaproteobacteria bacterium]|nr:AsmA family protein [Alphaproteobacteria bacterium]
MRKILYGLIALVVLVVVALVVVPFLVPTDTYKRLAEEQALQQTGRELKIAGDVSISLFPSVALEANEVSFANAPGGQAENMLLVSKVRVDVPVVPLLSSKVQVDRFHLIEPIIDLEIDESGVPNWQFGPPGADQAKPAAPADAEPGAAEPADFDITLNDIRVENATIKYTDRRTGKATVLTGVTGVLNLSRLDLAALQAGGTGTKPVPVNRDDWSDAPIDISSLKAVDLTFGLQVGSIDAAGVQVGDSAIDLAIDGGKLSVDLTKLSLYGGNGTGTVTADANALKPAITAKFDLAGVDAMGLLSAADVSDRLEGTMALALDVSTTGQTERELVSALAGNGNFAFTDGAIVGINLGKIARELEGIAGGTVDLDVADIITKIQNLFAGGAPTEKTDFARLSGSFTAQNGVIANPDLCMLAPLVTMTGATAEGGIALPPKTVDYVARLAVADGEVTPDESCDPEAGVAVGIKGPWSDPTIAPQIDLAGAVQSTIEGLIGPGKTEGTAEGGLSEKVGDMLRSGAEGVDNAVEGVKKFNPFD